MKKRVPKAQYLEILHEQIIILICLFVWKIGSQQTDSLLNYTKEHTVKSILLR